jgi:hypothetical protein
MKSEYIAFAGTRRIAAGNLREVASQAKAVWDRDRWIQVLIFDEGNSQQAEVDFSGSPEEVLARIDGPPIGAAPVTESEGRRPGRPKLGVVAREVTLLPRHWEWLAGQPGGASVALRKLVEEARRANQGKDRRRQALESAYRFLSAMAGNEPGFEEAARALFVGNRDSFDQIVVPWPPDVRDHAKRLAAVTFQGADA